MKTPDFWKKLAARYAGLNRRERLIVALLLVLGPALLIYSFVLEPEMRRLGKAKASLQTLQQNLLDVRRQEVALAELLKLDPDAAKKAELASLKSSLGGAGERLKKLEASLVPPEQMNATLERVLARHPNLQLISLKTLAPESVVPPPPRSRARRMRRRHRAVSIFSGMAWKYGWKEAIAIFMPT